MPISLSDDELDIVMSAAKPIPVHDRDAFLRDCVVELAGHQVLGAGLVSRVVSRLQRQHLHSPIRHGSEPKHSR